MPITQAGLRLGAYLTLQERYEEWRASPDGELVWGAVRDAALRLSARGFRHYGIAALFEAARYTYALRVGPDVEGFKLNNNWRSRMARDLMVAVPELDGFFELRTLTA
jgi:hypothetical protein